MYYELAVGFWVLVLIIFLIFWIVQEGTRWQKHRVLGGFARFIQASAGRAFVTFFLMTILFIPATLAIMQGQWYDLFLVGEAPSNTVPVVNVLLMMFLILSGAIPVMWSSFRTWRQAVRSAAEVRVRTTSET